MQKLRLPFFIAALVCMIAVVLIEIGSGFVLKNGMDAAASVKNSIMSSLPPSSGEPNPIVESIQEALGESDESDLSEAADEEIPGYGIPYMAVLDSVLLFTMILMSTGLIFPKKWHARLQGCASCLVSFTGILGTIAMIFIAIGLLILMVSLLLAVPFGTIAYMAIYGFFNTGSAALVLSILLMLKIAFLVLMVLAHQHYLRNCTFLLITFSSLIANILLSFLHGLVPGFLVSITDMLGAIIVSVCGCFWLVLLLVGSIPAMINALKSTATDF